MAGKFLMAAAISILATIFFDASGVAKPADFVPIVRSALSGYLKDPASAQIEITNHKGDAVCGRYNAKNSYGGYVGFKFFTFEPSSGDLYLLGTVIRKSGKVEDVNSMLEYDGTDFDEFERRAKSARAFNELTANKLRGCTLS